MVSLDFTTLIAVIGGTFTILATMISLFLWIRTEANSDRRQIQDVQREDRKDLLEISRNLENTMRAIQMEMKDFHDRIFKIENKN